MIKTLRAVGSAPMKLGNVQVQPVLSSVSSALRASSVLSNVTSPASMPAYQAPLNVQSMVHTPGSTLLRMPSPSLQTIGNQLITNPHFVLPGFHNYYNVILPTYTLHLEPSKTRDTHVTDDLVVSPKKFEPYEQLTGISHERPEIVMMTDFLPLFTKDVSHSQPSFIHLVENSGIYPYMTDAGRYVDTHIQARQLRMINAVQLARSVRQRYQYMSKQFADRHRHFTQSIDQLFETSTFLLQLVKGLDRLKAQLDLRDDLHTVNLRNVINHYVLNYTAIRSTALFHRLYDYARIYVPATFTVEDALVTLGYTTQNVKHNFSSTKIWLQLLHDLKDILRWHSMAFIDQDPVAQRNDNNAATINKKTTKHFTLRTNLPNLPDAKELGGIHPTQVSQAVSVIDQAYRTIYEDVHFKTEEARIAGLLNLLSKEFRYSTGLANSTVANLLQSHYNYPLQPTANVGLWDKVIGEFGNNISDVPAIEDNSLATLSQRQVGNVAVLTFESKYLDGDTGTLTPGSEYYVNQVLKTDGQSFDTSRMQELNARLQKAHQQFATLVNGLNILGHQTYDYTSHAYASYNSLLSSPSGLLANMTSQLIDRNTGNTLPQALNDNLGAVYTEANKNNTLKSALFAYTMARITRSYNHNVPFFSVALRSDNTPTTDTLIERILVELRRVAPQTSTALQHFLVSKFSTGGNTVVISQETIRSSMKSGTALTRYIESTMSQILSAFRSASSGDHTRYSGYIDTLMMMVAFDILLATIAKFNNQHIIAISNGTAKYNHGITSFTVSRTKINQRNSLQELTTRVDREMTLTQRLIYSVFNTLTKVTGALTGYINYLKSPPAIQKLKHLSSVIGDTDLLHMLMTEQQISMLASTVQDLKTALNDSGAIYGDGDEDGDGDFDVDDEIKDLDHALITPRLRNALYGMFGSDEFASQKGHNKKILTIGIPHGFTTRLKQKVSISNLKKTSFVNKQNDIVNVAVYKVDMENSDIIYKPKRYLFEMSRFPVRDQQRLLNLPAKPRVIDIINSIPTRDFGSSVNAGYDPVYGNLGGTQVAKGVKSALADETYSFLTSTQKQEMLQNHITSYLLEVYMKLLTGISVSDYHFDLVDPPRPVDLSFIEELTNHRVHHVTTTVTNNRSSAPENHPPTGGVLFTHTAAQKAGFVKGAANVQHPTLSNPAGVSGFHGAQIHAAHPVAVPVALEQQRVTTALVTSLEQVTARHVPLVLHDMQTINHLANVVTPQSDPLAVSKKLLLPKQFDRVFNVIVDPDEFEIDYDKTVRTDHGRQALEQMIRKGDIKAESENVFAARWAKTVVLNELRTGEGVGRPFVQNRNANSSPYFRFRDRDKNEGDLTFEKYFVVVETYGEEEV